MRPPSRSMGIAGGALLTVALVFAASRPAAGTYENARAVGKRCATCHTTLRPNAETLNETGRYYQLRRTLDGAPGVTPSTSAPKTGKGTAAPTGGAGAATSQPPAASTTSAAGAVVKSAGPVPAAAAAQTFSQMCAPCHGAKGEGTQVGKAFKGGPVAAQSPAAVAQTIRGGVPNTAMASFGGLLSPPQIDALARHVLTLAKAH